MGPSHVALSHLQVLESLGDGFQMSRDRLRAADDILHKAELARPELEVQRVRQVPPVDADALVGAGLVGSRAIDVHLAARERVRKLHLRRVLIPLIIGLFGLAGFFWLEGSTWVPEPVMPLRLFASCTSAVIYLNTFVVSMLNYWFFFFLPLYFQAVQLSTPTRSGVQILLITLTAVPRAAIWTMALSKWGVAIFAAILNIYSSQYAEATRQSIRGYRTAMPMPRPLGISSCLFLSQHGVKSARTGSKAAESTEDRV
ncbi:hypothetical protein PG995_012052 [Apiospora arundinis]